MGAPPEIAGPQLVELVDNSIDHSVVDGDITPAEGKKKKWAFKNIYDKISREEMPLFLMDFGMRAMMAGETMGDLGALGAAGGGAMAALEGRRATTKAEGLAAEETRAEDYKWSQEQGIAQQGADADTKRAETDEKYKGELSKSRSAGYNGEKVFMEQRLIAANVPPEEINALLLGDLSVEEKITRIVENLQKKQIANPYDDDPVTGKPYGELEIADMKDYAKQLLEMQKEIATEYRASQKAQEYIDKAGE
jgi:hypothetical protein